jgi:hypothetical protein
VALVLTTEIVEYLTSQPLSAVVDVLFGSVLAVEAPMLSINQIVDRIVAISGDS